MRRLLLATTLVLGLLVTGPLAQGLTSQPAPLLSPVDAHAAAAANDPACDLNSVPDPNAEPVACIDYSINGWRRCAYIPQWALIGVLFYYQGVFGATAIVGLFADATIAGLPLGAILGAIGIGGSVTVGYAIYLVDHNWGVGRWVCVNL